jgi:predicted ATPase/class 3 adenylate cyclase
MTEERKLVTVLFADIVGSTAISATQDAEVMRAALRRMFDEIKPVLEAHGGTIEKFIGDEVMAIFGVPQAHDDDADRAIRAAFAVRQQVKELSAGATAIAFELRIGINTGKAVTGTGNDSQFLVTGMPVNEAARIRGAAEPSEILVGALTKRLTDRAVEYGGPRSFEAKGIGQLQCWPAQRMRSVVPTQDRGVEGLRAPLIGRDEEVSLLINAFDRTKAEHRPHLVTIFGAAGAGKSRLAEELIARIPGARLRRGRCLPYGEGITLWPIQVMLRTDMEIVLADGLGAARRRIHDSVIAALPRNADDVDAVEHRLAVLMGLARADEAMPEIAATDVAGELSWGLRRYLEERAGQEPLLLVVEDIHWAAPALLGLVEDVAEWAKGALFILCLARPEFIDTRPSWGGGKMNATSIVLEPLTPDETRLLVAKLLDVDALPEDVRSSVIERAEGNPLYVEEFIRLLIETGRVVRRDGRWIAMSTGPLDVPPSLQGLIAARIDTASAEVKQLLRRAAVIGRFFTTTGIAALADGRPPESAQLRDALRRDLLVDADERGVGGGRMYRFKHVLIRDVIYESVPKAERALLHDRYGRWLELTLGDRSADFIDLIAYHAEQAYLYARELGLQERDDVARRAFDRLVAAATTARLREDASAALALYQRAARPADEAVISALERLEVDAYLGIERHRVEATNAALARLDELIQRARALGATKILIELLSRTFMFYPTARRRAAREEMRQLALATGDPEEIVRAMVHRINDTSPFEEDITYVREALDFARAHSLHAWMSRCLALLVFRERIVGRYSDAMRHLAEWQELLGPNASRKGRADLLTEKALILAELLDASGAQAVSREAVTLREEIGDVRDTLFAKYPAILALYLAGYHNEALAETDAFIAIADTIARPGFQRASRFFRALILIKLGRMSEAERAATDALAIPAPSADVPNPVQLGTLAMVAAASGDTSEATRLYEDARAEYDRLNQLNPDFRLEYARFLVDQGRIDEARRAVEQLRVNLGDPLAKQWLARADELHARLATHAT